MKAKLVRPGKNGYVYREWHDLPGFLFPLWFLLLTFMGAVLLYGILSLPPETGETPHHYSDTVLAGRHLAYVSAGFVLLLAAPLAVMKGFFVDSGNRRVRTVGLPFLHTSERLPLEGLAEIEVTTETHDFYNKHGEKHRFETFAVAFCYSDDTRRKLIGVTNRKLGERLAAELRAVLALN